MVYFKGISRGTGEIKSVWDQLEVLKGKIRMLVFKRASAFILNLFVLIISRILLTLSALLSVLFPIWQHCSLY